MIEELVERIKQEAVLLKYEGDSLLLDKALGEIECLIHAARLEIDVEWREARESSRKFAKNSPELEAILADLFNGEANDTEPKRLDEQEEQRTVP